MDQALVTVSGNAKKQRLGWVDGAKALAIIAIVLCHIWAWFQGFGTVSYITWVHSYVQLFYAFHVALFFVLSGFTSRIGWMGARGVAKTFKACYLPYLVSGVLIIIVGSLLTPQYSLGDWLAALFYGAGLYPGPVIGAPPLGVLTIGAIWFLPALFVGKILASLISAIKYPVLRLLFAGLLFIIGDQTSSDLFLPFGIQAGMNACWWITCGMIMKERNIFDNGSNCASISPLFITPALLYAFMIFFLIIPTPAYASCFYPNGFGIIDMLGTVVLSMSIMLVFQCAYMHANFITKGAELLGRSTLPFFCGHAISLAGEPTTAGFFQGLCSTYPNTMVLAIATLCALAAATFFAVATRYIPGLKYVYYPELRKKRAADADNAAGIAPLASYSAVPIDLSVTDRQQTIPSLKINLAKATLDEQQQR